MQNLAALPGAQHLERCFARKETLYMACRDGRQNFSRGRREENRANKDDQENGGDMSDFESLFKISGDPLRTFLWWRDLKLFQIKARPMVHTRGPGKFVLLLNLSSKVLVHDTKF